MSFKRSPSKVWWGSESLEYREVSTSPGSQDSGFSDAEGSPQNSKKDRQQNNKNSKDDNADIIKEENNNESTPKKLSQRDIAKNIFKGTINCNINETLNLTSNYKEKTTPVKENITDRLVKSETKKSPDFLKYSTDNGPFTEPVKRQRYIKHSPKVSRNLFTSKNTKECHETTSNQYSKLTQSTSLRSTEETNERENSCASQGRYYDTSSEISGTKSLPVVQFSPDVSRDSPRLRNSAPAVLGTPEYPSLEEHEAVTSFNSITSDSESELEDLFEGFGGPGHTSTPKGGSSDKMRHRRARLQERLRLRYHEQERVPPIHTDGVTVDNKAVLRWLEEARLSLEQECTTSLQCKSIAAELNQKVNHLAACATTILRGLLSHSRCIEMDYRNLNSESKHISPLVQSLAGNILDFLKTHTSHVSSKVLRLHDQIKHLNPEEVLRPMAELFSQWEAIQQQILVKEIKKLVDKLEDPTSDVDLRATLTGITSVALRNPDLIEHFVKADIIPILLILCEKCDGSSIRTLILRALSTMCCNSSAIRHFEKFSGVQIIADTLEEDSRPEPERSEAVALLAQVTAPWLEDNHSVKGLQEFSKTLIRSLTKFSSTTKCCQNLLLCAAALANLSSMDSKCISFLVRSESASVLLTAVKSRGPLVSVYLLEQVATLLANMAAVEGARTQLTEAEAPVALLHFLKPQRISQNEEVERRLQQKSVIALSRLCGEQNASRQVVENGGLTRLVQLCRDREARFNSDAVLVAALATLRKIAEAWGTDGLNIQDYQELVEPKLLDSFLAYSTQNESYV